MKKVSVLLLLVTLMILLTSCQNKIELEDNYDEMTFGYIDIGKDDIKIMQLTDIHLTYGFDALDRKTFKLLDLLVSSEQPDLIILTGDVFMSVFAKSLLKKIIRKLESYEIPWAYAFGNHEREYHQMEEIVNILLEEDTKYLTFHPGPKLTNDNSHGYSNYKLKLTNGNNPLLNIYLFDSKANRTDGVVDKDFPYDYLTVEQIEWYNNELLNDTVHSLAFMHIPIMQYLEYEGKSVEKPWPQGKDTGFFQTILDNNKKTIGIFSGHDHLNNHDFIYEDILLAYGVSSGFNAYGANNSKGARIITYKNGVLETYKVFGEDLK